MLTRARTFSRIIWKLPVRPFSAKNVVITAAGPDRPGIVHKLSTLIAPGNVEESRMTTLGLDFAILLRVTFPQKTEVDKVKKSIEEALPDYLVGARETGPVQATSPELKQCTITLEGPDQTGVVNAITEIFVKHNASIQDLKTETTMAAFAGYNIFELQTVINLPHSVDERKFRADLRAFEEKWGVDVLFKWGKPT